MLRYFLVSAPSEHLIMHALVNDLADYIKPPQEHFPPLNPFDAEIITSALVKQLSLQQTNPAPMPLRYLILLNDYAFHVLLDSGVSLWCRIFEAAFTRLWHEFARDLESLEFDFAEQATYYTTLLFYAAA